jgi:hypothetical protein
MIPMIQWEETRNAFIEGKNTISIYATNREALMRYNEMRRTEFLTKTRVDLNQQRLHFAGGSTCQFITYQPTKLMGLRPDLILVCMPCTEQMEAFLLSRLNPDGGILRQGLY